MKVSIFGTILNFLSLTIINLRSVELMAFPVPNSWISIIFHSIPVHNFASRDLQLIPVLQEIEYIPRTRMPSTGTQDTILLLEPSVKKCIIFQQDAESTVNQS
eukprot:UN0288